MIENINNIMDKNDKEIFDEEKNIININININEIQKENNDENINIKNFEEDLTIKKSESMSMTTQDTNNTISLELSQKSKR